MDEVNALLFFNVRAQEDNASLFNGEQKEIKKERFSLEEKGEGKDFDFLSFTIDEVPELTNGSNTSNDVPTDMPILLQSAKKKVCFEEMRKNK